MRGGFELPPLTSRYDWVLLQLIYCERGCRVKYCNGYTNDGENRRESV